MRGDAHPAWLMLIPSHNAQVLLELALKAGSAQCISALLAAEGIKVDYNMKRTVSPHPAPAPPYLAHSAHAARPRARPWSAAAGAASLVARAHASSPAWLYSCNCCGADPAARSRRHRVDTWPVHYRPRVRHGVAVRPGFAMGIL